MSDDTVNSGWEPDEWEGDRFLKALNDHIGARVEVGVTSLPPGAAISGVIVRVEPGLLLVRQPPDRTVHIRTENVTFVQVRDSGKPMLTVA